MTMGAENRDLVRAVCIRTNRIAMRLTQEIVFKPDKRSRISIRVFCWPDLGRRQGSSQQPVAFAVTMLYLQRARAAFQQKCLFRLAGIPSRCKSPQPVISR